MKTIESLKWRSAIKRYDPSKKVSETDFEKLIEAGNLAATSGGLQPFKIIVVRNERARKRLRSASWNQSQITDASHLIVFAIQNNLGEQLVEDYVNRMAEVRNLEVSSLTGMKEMLNGLLAGKDPLTKTEWAARQAYISLGTVLSAAAEIKIDTTPIEGFDPLQYQEILNLKSEGIFPVVVLAVGYRAEDDNYSKAPKVRKTRENFVLEIN